MNTKLYLILSGCMIVLLFLMVIMGSIQLIENTREFGYVYEVITITNGVEVVTTMTVWTNLAFMVFLSLIIYLLALPIPMMLQIEKARKEREKEE